MTAKFSLTAEHGRECAEYTETYFLKFKFLPNYLNFVKKIISLINPFASFAASSRSRIMKQIDILFKIEF